MEALTKVVGTLVGLAGHQNRKQKIRHVERMKEEMRRLQRENRGLEVELGACKKLLRMGGGGGGGREGGGGLLRRRRKREKV